MMGLGYGGGWLWWGTGMDVVEGDTRGGVEGWAWVGYGEGAYGLINGLMDGKEDRLWWWMGEEGKRGNAQILTRVEDGAMQGR